MKLDCNAFYLNDKNGSCLMVICMKSFTCLKATFSISA